LQNLINTSALPITLISLVICWCKTWPFTLKEEHRLRVFENRVLRRIFGSKRDEVTGDGGKLLN
jgi:hypothetical protein